MPDKLYRGHHALATPAGGADNVNVGVGDTEALEGVGVRVFETAAAAGRINASSNNRSGGMVLVWKVRVCGEGKCGVIKHRNDTTVQIQHASSRVMRVCTQL